MLEYLFVIIYYLLLGQRFISFENKNEIKVAFARTSFKILMANYYDCLWVDQIIPFWI